MAPQIEVIKMWWEYVIVAGLLVSLGYAFVSLVRFRTEMMTRKTDRRLKTCTTATPTAPARATAPGGWPGGTGRLTAGRVRAAAGHVRGRPGGQRSADLPVMAERVLDAAEQPAVGLGGRVHLPGARGDGPLDQRLRIGGDEQHPHRAAAQRRRAEVGVRGGLVGDPEPGVADRELGHHGLVGVGAADPVSLDGAERGLVELHGGAAVPDRELGLDPGLGSAAFVAGSVHSDRLTGPAVIPSCQTGSGGFH